MISNSNDPDNGTNMPANTSTNTNANANTGTNPNQPNINDNNLLRGANENTDSFFSQLNIWQVICCLWLFGALILIAYKFIMYNAMMGNLRRWSIPATDTQLLAVYDAVCTRACELSIGKSE